MEEATKLIITAQFPEADVDGPDRGRYQILPTDIGFLRTALGYALEDDPEGFTNSFVNWIEAVAVETAIDPEADTGVKVDLRKNFRPPPPPPETRESREVP